MLPPLPARTAPEPLRSYFQRNWNNETGLVNSVDGFASVSMWDQTAAIAALVNGEPWATIADTREKHNDLRFLSAKAAIGWHVLYNTTYTSQLFDFVQGNLKSKDGWYNGFYESLRQPNKTLTANNNGVILESLLYKQVGRPLTVWAGVRSQKSTKRAIRTPQVTAKILRP
ncbi:DUF3131 domain-containing protein [Nostoc sp. CHAB 5784]|nr:DUF3131 domain-containing protein [Nostoc mirabile CHAB5784]